MFYSPFKQTPKYQILICSDKFNFRFFSTNGLRKNATYSVGKKLEYPVQKFLARGFLFHADQLVNNIVFQLLNEKHKICLIFQIIIPNFIRIRKTVIIITQILLIL